MNVEQIVTFFCEKRQVSPEDVFGVNRKLKLWTTRYMIWHYLHYFKGYSASQLSTLFNRNRPSIFRGIKILKHQIMFHRDMRDEYHSIIKYIEEDASADTPSNDMDN